MSEKPGNGSGEPATALDQALSMAEQGDAQAQAFYDAFLNARLYVPTAEDDTGTPDDTVSLLVADIEGDGIVPVFDSEARLSTWAEQSVPFTVLPGHTLVEQLDPSLQVALNVGTEHFKLFVESELAWLRERLGETVTALEPTEPEGSDEFKSDPPPQSLVDALLPAIHRNELVGAAFLVEGERPVAGKTRRYLLTLDVGDAGEEIFTEVARDIGIAARAALGSEEYLDIISLNPLEGIGRALIERAVEPFFVRAEVAPSQGKSPQ